MGKAHDARTSSGNSGNVHDGKDVAVLRDERERRMVRGAPDFGLPVKFDPDVIIGQNMIVSAGAGSGKTKALVERLIAFIRLGVDPSAIVAITYTRKAAGELRTRFFTALLKAKEHAQAQVASGNPDLDAAWADEADLLEAAIGRSEEVFIGTIHSWCSWILRLYSFQAGLPRNFTHLDDEEEIRLRRRFWNGVMDIDPSSDPDLRELIEAGVSDRALFHLFGQLVKNASVQFDLSGIEKPDPAPVFDRLMGYADALIPALVPSPNPDALQRFLTRLVRRRENPGPFSLYEQAYWLRLAQRLFKIKNGTPVLNITQKNWQPPDEEKGFGKRLAQGQERQEGTSFLSFLVSELDPVANEWQYWLHDKALSFVGKSVASYREHRMVSGRLTFDDMLMEATRLLFDSPAARTSLRARIAHILVDEFQDTDPEQAAMLFAYAAESIDRDRWTKADLERGRLTFVGDEKQSIYRFRKADFQAFEEVWKAIDTAEEPASGSVRISDLIFGSVNG